VPGTAINTVDLWVETECSDRLDRWLAQQLPALSRARLQKLIETGHVQLNHLPCQVKKHPLKRGDRLSIVIPAPQPLDLQPEQIPLDVLYEDEDLIIVNKPAGMVVHPAPGHSGGTLVNALLSHCDDLAGIGGIERPGIVHRLDKDTTGALVVAKTDFSLQHLQNQIRQKTAQREYLGVVHGVPKSAAGSIEQALGRHPVDRKKMAVLPVEKGGRNALTHWQIQERLGNYTLLHYQLSTGRTHQIRVHSAFMGHPILGDPDYSSGRVLGINLPGQALHAHRLRLVHPRHGNVIEAIAPPPEHFEKLLHWLRRRA
jgi:23S rRNA pseudouridine1911/1915/1917 synthase